MKTILTIAGLISCSPIILLFTALQWLECAAMAQSNTVTVTITLDAKQAEWLAANAATNTVSANEILQRQLRDRLNQQVRMLEKNTPEKIAQMRLDQQALKSFRALDDSQKIVALAVISGRKLTPDEKVMVRTIAERVLNE